MSDNKPIKARRPAPVAKEFSALPESAAVVTLPVPARRRPSGDAFLSTYQKTFAAISESQSAVTADFTALVFEMNGLAHANLTAASESMAALFAAKSLADAVEIQLGFARRSFDALVDGSTKLGEIGLRLANDAAKPMLTPFAAV
jgi:hypothetical protein